MEIVLRWLNFADFGGVPSSIRDDTFLSGIINRNIIYFLFQNVCVCVRAYGVMWTFSGLAGLPAAFRLLPIE